MHPIYWRYGSVRRSYGGYNYGRGYGRGYGSGYGYGYGRRYGGNYGRYNRYSSKLLILIVQDYFLCMTLYKGCSGITQWLASLAQDWKSGYEMLT